MNLTGGCRQASRTLRAHADWVARARFDDYLVAAGAVSPGLPVIGRHLEPMAGMAALSVWGLRYLPDFMTSARTRWAPGPQMPGAHNWPGWVT